MNIAAWVTLIAALTTALGALTALIIAINGLRNSTPVVNGKPVEPPQVPAPVIPNNHNSAPL